MRKILLLLLAMLLSACAQEPTPTPTVVQEPTAAAEPTAEPTEEPVAEPTEEPVAEPTDEPTAEPAAAEAPIYLAIIWHQHQPVYYKDSETNSYVRPWVRMHATKDYVDMAAILTDYPNVKATFNLTPSLIRQLDDLAAGARDDYWLTAEVPAADLTDEQKQYLLDRFFDTNRQIIGRFPRYQELLEMRDSGTAFTTDDYRDLQILFNLAWVDPDWLAQEPLASLVEKGSNFSEEDKAVLFAEHLRLIEEVVPIHRALQDAGQIEVTMTPFAHPILPLLVDTNAALIALPELSLPPRFTFGADAQAHVKLGVDLYTDHFGRPPRGMWPAEGSVSQQIVTMVAQNGIEWMATDEGVLANSLGFDSFTRDANDLVQEADVLYRPYYVQGQRGGPVAVVFRDVVISDKVGFTYSGMDGDAAAADFVGRIHAIRDALNASGAEGPHLVSVILDGENAWEFYENDGKEFLHGLYQRLNDDPNIITVTPSEFLEIAPEQPTLEELWAGSWINHDFATWIGEDEENRAWDYLLQTREFVKQYENGRKTPPSEEALAHAMELMYIAEGSDWFWWYGADQNSGNDESFDSQFRSTIQEIYRTLGEEPPSFANVPIIPEQAAASARPLTGLLTPTIDGVVSEGEWEAAGLYRAEGGVMAAADTTLEELAYGFDSQNFYLNLIFSRDALDVIENGRVDIYLSTPGGGEFTSFSQAGSLIGFPANRLITIDADGATLLVPRDADRWSADGVELEEFAIGTNQLELAVPLSEFGTADAGDSFSMRAYYAENVGGDAFADIGRIPEAGPAVLAVPDLGNINLVLDIADPENDDHGPGSYTYPQDAVFKPGNFDIVNFQAGYDDNNVIFKFTLRGPVDNHWGSPNGMSGLTLDVYIDKDGDGVGGTALLPGRNLTLQEGFAWDYAIHAEGWTPGIYTPGEGDPVQIAGPNEFTIVADPGQQKVTIRIPKAILGDDPESWRYAAMVLGQEGFPSGGVLRVRDVAPAAEQWRFGGAPAGATNHTRVIDLVWPEAGEQEAWLADMAPSSKGQTDLTAEDFARVPMLAP